MIGDIVLYALSPEDAETVNGRRGAGLQMRRPGNPVAVGDLFPMVIVRVWVDAVNGQVLLDGPDTLWVTSVTQGDGPRQFL